MTAQHTSRRRSILVLRQEGLCTVDRQLGQFISVRFVSFSQQSVGHPMCDPSSRRFCEMQRYASVYVNEIGQSSTRRPTGRMLGGFRFECLVVGHRCGLDGTEGSEWDGDFHVRPCVLRSPFPSGLLNRRTTSRTYLICHNCSSSY